MRDSKRTHGTNANLVTAAHRPSYKKAGVSVEKLHLLFLSAPPIPRLLVTEAKFTEEGVTEAAGTQGKSQCKGFATVLSCSFL